MNDIVIADTNIVSYIFNEDTRAALYAPHFANVTVSLSFMTIAEMYFGADRRGWGQNRRRRLDAFLRNYPIVHSTPEICRIWAEISAECERQGRRIVAADAWIATCALRYQAPLITHNRRDFEAIPGLQIISEST